MPHKYGGKNCSNARGKIIWKLIADTSNYVLTFLEAILLSNWGFKGLLKLTDLCHLPPEPCGGEYQINFGISEIQNLPRWVCDYNSETRNVNHGTKMKVLQRCFPWRSHIFVPIKSLWGVDVIMPQKYGGKNCSNARGKTIWKLIADTPNYVLTLLGANLLSNWGFQCLLKLDVVFMRYAP